MEQLLLSRVISVLLALTCLAFLCAVGCGGEDTPSKPRRVNDPELKLHLQAEIKRLQGIDAATVKSDALKRVLSALKPDSTAEDLAGLIADESVRLAKARMDGLQATVGSSDSTASTSLIETADEAQRVLGRLQLTASENALDLSNSDVTTVKRILDETKDFELKIASVDDALIDASHELDDAPAIISACRLALLRSAALNKSDAKVEAGQLAVATLRWVNRIRCRGTLMSGQMLQTAVNFVLNTMTSLPWMTADRLEEMAGLAVAHTFTLEPSQMLPSETRSYIWAMNQFAKKGAATCEVLFERYGAVPVEDWLSKEEADDKKYRTNLAATLDLLRKRPHNLLDWSHEDFHAVWSAVDNTTLRGLIKALAQQTFSIQLDALYFAAWQLRKSGDNKLPSGEKLIVDYVSKRKHLVTTDDETSFVAYVSEDLVKMYGLAPAEFVRMLKR